MLVIKDLVKIYDGGLRAVDGVTLELSPGEIFALLGPNGAGKTSTIRVCTTLSGFDSGHVEVAGHDVDTEAQQVRQSIGYVAQDAGVDYFLTGRENLQTQGHLYRMSRRDIRARIAELAGYFDLTDSLDKLVSMYSGGMRRKLDIAMALIHRPPVLFLDEPTLGLDTHSRRALWAYIRKLNAEFGLTILLTTHYLEEADHLAHRVGIIDKGRIQVLGTADELKDQIHGDVITLEPATGSDGCQQLMAALKKQDWVKDQKQDGERLFVYVDNGAQTVARVVTLASESGIDLKNLSLARPSLDDVFIRYTGGSMLKSEESGETPWWEQWAGKGGGKWAKKWQAENADSGDETASEPAWQGNDWVNADGTPKQAINEDDDWHGNEWVNADGTPREEKAMSEEKDDQPAWQGNEWVNADGTPKTPQDKDEPWQGNEWVNADGTPKKPQDK